jgi:hypothetical protein
VNRSEAGPAVCSLSRGGLLISSRKKIISLLIAIYPPMKEIEHFAYFLLPLPVETRHQFAIKVTFVPKRSRKVTFTLVDQSLKQ